MVHQRRCDWLIFTLRDMIDGQIATMEDLGFRGAPKSCKHIDLTTSLGFLCTCVVLLAALVEMCDR